MKDEKMVRDIIIEEVKKGLIPMLEDLLLLSECDSMDCVEKDEIMSRKIKKYIKELEEEK